MNWKLKTLIAVSLLFVCSVFTKLPSHAQSINRVFHNEELENVVDVTNNQVVNTKSDESRAVISYNGSPIPIADNNAAGIDISIPVSGIGTVFDLDFVFDTGGACDATVGNTNAAVDHTFVGDLTFKLTSPTGQVATFMARRGGTRENICATRIDDDAGFPNVSTLTNVTGLPVAGNFTPETIGPLSVFDGLNANGIWTLNVSDNAVLDTGSLRRFSLVFNVIVDNFSDAPVDFDGDGKTDVAIVRNIGAGSSGATNQLRWFYNLSSGGGIIVKDWGVATDKVVSEDFDRDGKDDVAVWRPGAANVAAFYILQSQTNTVRIDVFGQTGDDPTVVGDYDGDNQADIAVYRAGATAGAQSTWYYRGSLANPIGNITFIPWGMNGDNPSPGDYDGDNKNDFVVRRGTNFWMRRTSAGTAVVSFGLASDFIVPGDYDGDGRSDIATIRNVGGLLQWQWLPSSIGGIQFRTFGNSLTDIPIQGNYDGDGRTDIAVWKPASGQFWVQATSSGAVSSFVLGATGDFPVANYNTH
jgi:subtilisin-like proprotein convertase family protein